MRLDDLLRAWRPDLEIRSLEALAQGEFSRAYLLNGHQVVRVPKHHEAARSLVREACILSRIGDRLPVAVPVPTSVTDPSGSGASFSIHEMIPGVALTRERWRSMDEPARRSVARKLGGMLAALHGLDPDTVKGCGLDAVNHAAELDELVGRLAGKEKGVLPDRVRNDLLARFRGSVEGAESGTHPRALLHADVSPEHVLVDPETGELTGVIDWGDAVIGDPARDFIFLYEDWGSDLLELVLESYGLEEAGRLGTRVRLRYLADQAGWTLDRAREGRTDDLAHGVRALEAALEEFQAREGPD